jgi:hypothetical protein
LLLVTVASLGRRGGRAGQHRAGGGLSVDRVRLAALPAGAPAWPVDLHHGEVLIQEVAGSGRRRAADAFHPIASSCPCRLSQRSSR